MPLLLGTLLISVPIPGYSQAQSDNAPRGAMVHVVITDMAVQDNNELPQLMKDDVKVKQRKSMYTVTQLTPSQLGPRLGARGTNGPTVYHSMPTISVDADSASETRQRYNVIVSSIYSPGVR
jgi:hypothetical protein